jgi:hypothetical protein
MQAIRIEPELLQAQKLGRQRKTNGNPIRVVDLARFIVYDYEIFARHCSSLHIRRAGPPAAIGAMSID